MSATAEIIDLDSVRRARGRKPRPAAADVAPWVTWVWVPVWYMVPVAQPSVAAG